jgi:Zn-dependent protease with chaperone function
MHYGRLLILVCVAALSCAATLAALAALVADAPIQRVIACRRPRTRARMLFALRAAPFVAGIVASIGLALAFIRHEPRHTTEEPGVVLLLLVAWTVVLGLVGTGRLVGTASKTARCHRLLRRCGQRIELPGFPLPVWRVAVNFPVAAVCGVLKPRLILSARVLDECSPEELQTVLRHEGAHLRRRDNLARAALIALPDAVALLRGDDAIARRWHEAVEEAADDEAVGENAESRLALAAALVRVGRLATATPPDWMPALALFDGDNLERRVRRLLNPPSSPPPPRRPVQRTCAAVLGILMAGAVVWTTTGPRPLHDLMEWAVRNLP